MTAWLAEQPLAMIFSDHVRLKAMDRERAIALITIPILALALVVGASFNLNGGPPTASSPPVQEEEDAMSAKTSPSVDMPEASQEPEEFHSLARYMENLEVFRNAIRQLELSDELQEQRVAEILGGLEVRQWDFVGEFEGDLCYRFEERIECIGSEVLANLKASGEEYSADHPEGIGLCYDWFDGVCMSGDWFDSQLVFEDAIRGTVSFVLTGTQVWEEDPKNLETSPTYEAARTATISDPDFFSASEWEKITQTLFPDRSRSELQVSPNTEGEGFCLGTQFDGDCFASKEALDKALAELQQAYRDGTCSGWATGSDGVSVCTAIWVGNWPNHTSMSLGEALCDNNTGRCELIPTTDRTCLYNCSITR